EPVLNTMIKIDRENGPKGMGYVFTLVGEHYRNDPNDDSKQGVPFVQSTLLQDLNKFEFAQPGTPQPVPIRKIGLSHACIASQKKQPNIEYYPRGKKTTSGTSKTGGTKFGTARPPMGTPMPVTKNSDGQKKDGETPDKKIISRLDFTVQFCWIPTASDKRLAEDPLKVAGTTDGTNASNPNAAGAAPQAATPAPGASATPNPQAPTK
ncbi:MAG: hypothetical protein ABL962_18330, partial [Fimbriimonadaceae bacterium]